MSCGATIGRRGRCAVGSATSTRARERFIALYGELRRAAELSEAVGLCAEELDRRLGDIAALRGRLAQRARARRGGHDDRAHRHACRDQDRDLDPDHHAVRERRWNNSAQRSIGCPPGTARWRSPVRGQPHPARDRHGSRSHREPRLPDPSAAPKRLRNELQGEDEQLFTEVASRTDGQFHGGADVGPDRHERPRGRPLSHSPRRPRRDRRSRSVRACGGNGKFAAAFL